MGLPGSAGQRPSSEGLFSFLRTLCYWLPLDRWNAAMKALFSALVPLLAHTSPSRTSPIGGAEKLPYLGRETVAVAVGRVVGFRRISGIDHTVTRVRAEVTNG